MVYPWIFPELFSESSPELFLFFFRGFRCFFCSPPNPFAPLLSLGLSLYFPWVVPWVFPWVVPWVFFVFSSRFWVFPWVFLFFDLILNFGALWRIRVLNSRFFFLDTSPTRRHQVWFVVLALQRPINYAADCSGESRTTGSWLVCASVLNISEHCWFRYMAAKTFKILHMQFAL